VVSVQRSELFTENSTLLTPTLSEAVAVMVTVVPCFTVLALRGFVIFTVGDVVSGTRGGVGVNVLVGNGVDVGVEVIVVLE